MVSHHNDHLIPFTEVCGKKRGGTKPLNHLRMREPVEGTRLTEHDSGHWRSATASWLWRVSPLRPV